MAAFAGGAGPNPDDLLNQIAALLDQYLALGSDTPVAPEAQALSDAIHGQKGGAAADTLGMPSAGPADMGGPPPDMGGAMPSVPPDKTAAGAEPPPNKGAKSFKAANVTALDRLKKRNAKSSKAKK